jgi:hypothetical protein
MIFGCINVFGTCRHHFIGPIGAYVTSLCDERGRAAASVARPTRSRGFASLSTQIDVARRGMPRIRRADMALSRQAFYSGSRISMPRSALARELSQAEEQVAKDPDRIAHQREVVSHHEEGGLFASIGRAPNG